VIASKGAPVVCMFWYVSILSGCSNYWFKQSLQVISKYNKCNTNKQMVLHWWLHCVV